MTKEQSEYVLTLYAIIAAIDSEAKVSGRTGDNWGESNPEELKELVTNIHIGQSGVLNASKVISTVLEQETAKQIGHANDSLERIVRNLNDCRIAV